VSQLEREFESGRISLEHSREGGAKAAAKAAQKQPRSGAKAAAKRRKITAHGASRG